MDLTLINTIIGIAVGIITLLGLLSAFLSKENIKEKIRNWLIKPTSCDTNIKEDLNFFDVMHGVTVLQKKLGGLVTKETGLIICVGRGGAVVGGLLAKAFYTNRLRMVALDAEKEVSFTWNVAELENQQVLLVDDCIRKGHTIKKAYDLILKKCKEVGIEPEIQIACLLCTREKKGEKHSKSPLNTNNIVSAYSSDSVNSKMPWDVNW